MLWSQVGYINDIIRQGSTKQFVRGRRGQGREDILGQVDLSKDYYMRGATLPRIQAGLTVFSCIFSWWGWIGEIIVANTMQLTGVGCQ